MLKLIIEIQYKGEIKKFTPEEISSIILTKMKETTKSLINKTISNEVITLFISMNHKYQQKMQVQLHD